MANYNNENKYSAGLMTLVIAGSVDDGKSTLIGRLLYDIGQIYDDQIEAVKRAEKVEGNLDFSLFTDGLSAEREQKITIDVAYRYFSTKKRRYIVADVPGHEQYTKNMATGASKAQAALILIDARKGLLEQTRRHLFIATLLRITNIIAVVNKMDLVGYNKQIFNDIKNTGEKLADKLGINNLKFIPVSSITGEMIVNRGKSMDWYKGETVLENLDNLEAADRHNLYNFSLPVQYIIRPNQDFRGYAGRVESGAIKVGDTVKIFPSGKISSVREIIVAGGRRNFAVSAESVVITLNDEVDISRGDMIAKENENLEMGNEIDSMICWFADEPLEANKRYLLKHSTKTSACFVNSVKYKINLITLDHENTGKISLNDIGRVVIRTQKPLFFESYEKNKNIGNFIIIDELTNITVGAGMIMRGELNNSIHKIEDRVDDYSRITLAEKVEISKIVIQYAIALYPRIFATCSFGKDSRVIVDLVSQINKNLQFIGIDTGYEFPETLSFAKELIHEVGMNFRWVKPPGKERRKIEKNYGNNMIKDNQYKCCAMKKPALATILPNYDAWITGLRRDEAETRKDIKIIETGGYIIKINPIAFWTQSDVWQYIRENVLSYHPLYKQGYSSLGCQPCTNKINNVSGDSERAGRFIGTDHCGKECGIH